MDGASPSKHSPAKPFTREDASPAKPFTREDASPAKPFTREDASPAKPFTREDASPSKPPPLDFASPSKPPPLDFASPSKPPPLNDAPPNAAPPLNASTLINATPPRGASPPHDAEAPILADAVPIMAAPVNSYQENFLVWKINKEYCKNRLKSGDPFSLRRMLVEPTWEEALDAEFGKEYFQGLNRFVKEEDKTYSLCPPKYLIFRCFNTIPFHSVKVVILGQKGPYPNRSRATGLAYAVAKRNKHPAELERILVEVTNDIGGGSALKGDLESWVLQGVMLLNFSLTSRIKMRNAHADHGWEQFIDSVIERINSEHRNIVFMLWGQTAKTKIALIDDSKHLVLVAPSPSQKEFLGCRHFSKANQYLQNNGKLPIDWKMQ